MVSLSRCFYHDKWKIVRQVLRCIIRCTKYVINVHLFNQNHFQIRYDLIIWLPYLNIYNKLTYRMHSPAVTRKNRMSQIFILVVPQ